MPLARPWFNETQHVNVEFWRVSAYNRDMKTLEVETKEQAPEVFDEATLEAVDKASESFEAGRGLTIKEARELNRKRYQAWLNPPLEQPV